MLERKALQWKVTDVDAHEGTFYGYASVFGNEDSYGDVVEPGAFTKTIKESGGRFPVLWQHEVMEPIGVTASVAEDAVGLRVVANVCLKTQRGSEVIELIKIGALRGLSIGYKTIKQRRVDGVRHLEEVRLFEVSPVTFPANEQARVAGVKDSFPTAAMVDLKRSIDGLVAALGRDRSDGGDMGSPSMVALPTAAEIHAYVCSGVG